MHKHSNIVALPLPRPAEAFRGKPMLEHPKAAEARADVVERLGLKQMAGITSNNSQARNAAAKLVMRCADCYAALKKQERALVSWKEIYSAMEDMCTVVQRGMDRNEHLRWRNLVNGAAVRIMKLDHNEK
ncbi:Uncharacterised protein [uncultured archaeon]|nr:Uncharacterised protein [uncultured archaeon]